VPELVLHAYYWLTGLEKPARVTLAGLRYSHAARCVACHGVRSHAVPVALRGTNANISWRLRRRKIYRERHSTSSLRRGETEQTLNPEERFAQAPGADVGEPAHVLDRQRIAQAEVGHDPLAVGRLHLRVAFDTEDRDERPRAGLSRSRRY
jgi:hypothetical protein